MDTHAIQMLLHYQSGEADSSQEKFKEFIKEVRRLAENHGITFDQYESFTLKGKDHYIAPCQRCGDLTIDKETFEKEVKGMVPYFWEFVKLGSKYQGEIICQRCSNLK